MNRESETLLGRHEIEPGWTLIITPVHRLKGSTSEVAKHEAFHTGVALLMSTKVKRVSIIPGPGYLGITELGEFNAAAAMAADAMGGHGTDHDKRIVWMMGKDAGSAADVARGLIYGHMEEIMAIASLLEAKGTITGAEAQWAMEQAADPDVNIIIMGPDGQQKHFVGKINEVGGLNLFPAEFRNASKDLDRTNNLEDERKVPLFGDHPMVENVHQIKPVSRS